MHPTMFALFDNLSGLGTVVLATVGLVFFLFLIMAIWASRYTKVGPNQVLVVSGHRRGAFCSSSSGPYGSSG